MITDKQIKEWAHVHDLESIPFGDLRQIYEDAHSVGLVDARIGEGLKGIVITSASRDQEIKNLKSENEKLEKGHEILNAALHQSSEREDELVKKLLRSRTKRKELESENKDLKQKCFDMQMALGPAYEWSRDRGITFDKDKTLKAENEKLRKALKATPSFETNSVLTLFVNEALGVKAGS